MRGATAPAGDVAGKRGRRARVNAEASDNAGGVWGSTRVQPHAKHRALAAH